jgi:hypothetical protein
MLVKISEKKKTLISWLEQPKNYVDLYKKIISSATPTTLDVFLKKISLSSLADQRRIARIKNCLMDIEQKKGRSIRYFTQHNRIRLKATKRCRR